MSDAFDPMDDDFSNSLSMDTDGDGILDTVLSDTTGDGIVDTAYIDTTGDGLLDTVITQDHLTGASAIARDLDGDGVVDILAFDHDGDGLIDEAYTGEDIQAYYANPTSTTDAATSTTGPFDPLAPFDGAKSATESGITEVASSAADEGSDADSSGDDGGADDEPIIEEIIYDDDPIDPIDPMEAAIASGVYGEPQADIMYHQVQPGPVDCLPTSVSMVLSELTGQFVAADDLVAMANDMGFMQSDGMLPLDALTLLENYGVEAELTSATVEDLKEALVAGDPIIVGVDSADLYYGGGGPFDPGLEAGHAVVVTGITDGPPSMVYINDPGFPDGAGVEIPMELFLDSWEDTENTMVVATLPGAETVDDGALSGLKRVLLLPVNFVLAK